MKRVHKTPSGGPIRIAPTWFVVGALGAGGILWLTWTGLEGKDVGEATPGVLLLIASGAMVLARSNATLVFADEGVARGEHRVAYKDVIRFTGRRVGFGTGRSITYTLWGIGDTKLLEINCTAYGVRANLIDEQLQRGLKGCSGIEQATLCREVARSVWFLWALLLLVVGFVVLAQLTWAFN